VFVFVVEVEFYAWSPPKKLEKQEKLAFVVEFCA
jgi:hypothetical protein